MRSIAFFIILLIGSLLLNSCSSRTITTDNEAAIERVICKSIDWALDKDLQGLYDVLARDEALFIMNPDSAGGNHVGFEAFKTFAEKVFMDKRFQAQSMALRDLRITKSQSGTVAWYSGYLDDICTWNSQPASWHNIRWTGVLEKRNGRWVHVQQHYSFPSDRKQKKD